MNQDVRKRFEMRSALIASIRNFLTRDGYFEVEPPSLQPIYGGGFARPFKTHHNALNLYVYLPISNEMYLKRLLTGGFEKVYSMTKVFRNEGVDQYHTPEFTMLEAQAAYTDYHYGMDLIERIFESVALEIKGTTQLPYQGKLINVGRPWKRMSMVESIKEIANVDVLKLKNVAEGKKAIVDFSVAAKQKEEMETMHSIGELIAFLFEIKVEETLIQPTIIYDYPVEVCPLAKRCAGDPRFAERFEYFVFGSELGNNYTELNDPVDLKKRFIEEKKREEAGFEEAHQFDDDYLEAIEHGFPPTCGIAIGIDRLVMLFTDSKNIKEVIAFPTLRPELAPKIKLPEKKKSVKKQKLDFTRKEAWELLNQNMKNQNLIRHCLSVEAVMRSLAKHFHEDEELWGIAGLLHDGDYEKTKGSPERHTLEMVDWLKKAAVDNQVLLEVILSHNFSHTGQNPPKN